MTGRRTDRLPGVLLLAVGLGLVWTGAVLVDASLELGAGPRLDLSSIPDADVLTETESAASADDVYSALLVPSSVRLLAAAALAGFVTLLQLAVVLWVRATRRTHEMAVRRVVGGSTRQLIAPLLTTAGRIAARGVGGAVAIVAGLVALAAVTAPPGASLRFGFDATTAGAGAVLLLGCVLLFGLLPATVPPGRALRALRTGGRATPRKSGGLIVTFQVAVAVALLYAGAVALTGPAGGVEHDAPASGAGEAMVASVSLDGRSPAAWSALRTRLAGSGIALASPGAALGLGPRDGVLAECPGCFVAGLHTPLRPVDTLLVTIDPGFVDAMGLDVVDGGPLPTEPGAGVLVNRAFVATGALGSGSVVGRTVRLATEPLTPYPVAGVVADIPPPGDAATALPTVYLAWPPAPPPAAAELVAPAAAEATVRAVVSGLPDVAVGEITRLTEARSAFYGPFRWLSGWIALLGLVAYGIAAYGAGQSTRAAVALRRRELGIRLALGATPGRIVRTVGLETARQVARGAVLGGLLVVFLRPGAGWQAGLLAAVTALVAIMAIAGGLLPARAAAAVPPSTSLRAE